MVKPSTSPHNFRLVVVSKKDKEGKVSKDDHRVCVNVSPMNPEVEDFNYNPPRIDEIRDRMSNSKYFSELDVEKAFHQQVVKEAARKLLAFSDDNGIWQFKVLPYGIMQTTFLSWIATMSAKVR